MNGIVRKNECKYYPCVDADRKCYKKEVCDTRTFFDKYGTTTLGAGAMSPQDLERMADQLN